MLRMVFLLVSLYCSLILNAQKEIRLSIIPVDSSEIRLTKHESLDFIVKDSLSALKKLKEFSDEWISRDYLAFSYDSIRYDSIKIRAYVNKGPAFYFDSIKIEEIPGSVLRKSGYPQDKFGYPDFIRIRRNIIQYYENNGYPFAQVKLEDINFENQNIKAKLRLIKNGLFKFDSVVLKGNPRISRKFILHQLQIKPGAVYDQSKIDNINKQIEGLSFIKQTRRAELEFTEGKADLFLYLKKNPANYFSGILGLTSDSVSQAALQMTGDINLSLLNVFKIGEKIDFYWNKYNSSSQNLKLGFQFPYLFVLPIGFNWKLGIEKFQTGYLNTTNYLAFDYVFAGNNGIKVYYQNKRSFLIDQDTIQNLENIGYKITTTGFGFSLNTTNYIYNPTQGYSIDFFAGYGSSSNEGQESKPIIELGFDGALYIHFTNLFNLAIINKSAGMICGSEFYKNQLYKIGGIKTLRGFDEQSVYASAYSIISIEPRLMSGKNSDFFLFTDLCWYECNQSGVTNHDWPVGFGVGMDIDTKAGIFKLIYALGTQQGNPIRFSNSKIHFGFSTRF